MNKPEYAIKAVRVEALFDLAGGAHGIVGQAEDGTKLTIAMTLEQAIPAFIKILQNAYAFEPEPAPSRSGPIGDLDVLRFHQINTGTSIHGDVFLLLRAGATTIPVTLTHRQVAEISSRLLKQNRPGGTRPPRRGRT